MIHDDPCVNYHSNADTSVEAWGTISDTTEAIKERIYTIILNFGGATCEEVEKRTKLSHQTVSARITELVKELKIKDSGIRRKTKSGRNARVYIRVQEGQQNLF